MKAILVVKTIGLKNLLVSDNDFHALSKICRPTANHEFGYKSLRTGTHFSPRFLCLHFHFYFHHHSL